jgi:hypothetical protein
MNIAQVKNNFHNLIDRISDPNYLEKFYQMMEYSAPKSGDWFDELSPDQRKELSDSLADLKDPENFIPLEQAKREMDKWFTK